MHNPSKKPEKIRQMFNSIAKDYNKLNNIMTFGLHSNVKKSILAKIKDKKCSKVLDLCTGTGDLALMLKKMYPESEIIGVDFSKDMLAIAEKRSDKIKFLEADCTNLPFGDGEFDICVISFGLRNIENLEGVISEIYRVLKSDGIFINIDLGKPNWFFNLFLKPYMYIWVAILGKIFHGDETPYKYLAESNETFPSPDELVKIYQKYGFSIAKKHNYLFGQIAAQISQK